METVDAPFFRTRLSDQEPTAPALPRAGYRYTKIIFTLGPATESGRGSRVISAFESPPST